MRRNRLGVNDRDRINLCFEVLGRVESTIGIKVLDARLFHKLRSNTSEKVLHLARIGDQVLFARNTVMSISKLRDGLMRFTEAETRRDQFCWHAVLPDPALPSSHAPRRDLPIIVPG